jgi:hypothetical protein
MPESASFTSTTRTSPALLLNPAVDRLPAAAGSIEHWVSVQASMRKRFAVPTRTKPDDPSIFARTTVCTTTPRGHE